MGLDAGYGLVALTSESNPVSQVEDDADPDFDFMDNCRELPVKLQSNAADQMAAQPRGFLHPLRDEQRRSARKYASTIWESAEEANRERGLARKVNSNSKALSNYLRTIEESTKPFELVVIPYFPVGRRCFCSAVSHARSDTGVRYLGREQIVYRDGDGWDERGTSDSL